MREQKRKREVGEIKLGTLCGGALEERFQDALDRVKVNMEDPNTVAADKRSVTIKLTFEQNDTREFSTVTVDVTEKLAGPVPLALPVIHRKSTTGRHQMLEQQPRLFDSDDDAAMEVIS